VRGGHGGHVVPPLHRWQAHPLVRMQRWLWPVLVAPLALAAGASLVLTGFSPESAGFAAVAAGFVVIAWVQWRAGRTEIRLESDRIVLRGVRRERVVALADVVRVTTDERVAHQVVLVTRNRQLALPRSVTSKGSLGPDDRSEEIRAAIAEAVQRSRVSAADRPS
jgi:hypothetical protein